MRGPGPFKVCGALGEALVRKQARSVCRRAKQVHSSWGSGGCCEPPSRVRGEALENINFERLNAPGIMFFDTNFELFSSLKLNEIAYELQGENVIFVTEKTDS